MVTQKGIFTEHICTQRKLALRARKAHNKTQAIAAWIEKDHLLTGPGDALVIILNSLGCQWGLGSEGGCSMCGYSNETSKGITETDLIAQVDSSLTKFANKAYTAIKIFNSGSFLDESEIPIKAQEEIIKLINQVPVVSEIIIESRPEFVTTKALSRLTKLLSKEKQLEIGIGLESSNDAIRINNINKGFLFTDYQKAVKIALKHNVRVKTYLLLKPPFMTEKEAIEDTIKSAIVAIKTGSRSLSINPVNIQNGTMVFYLWRKGLYRSPWYWSLQKVILEIWNHLEEEGMTDKVDRILSDPSGASTQRGVHNCYKCNRQFLKNLKEYSLQQKPELLENMDCDCHEVWKELLLQEQASRDLSIHKLEQGLKFLH